MTLAERDEQGLTRVELLIVAVVVGAFAAVVVVNLLGLAGSSAIKSCNDEKRSVETAVAAYLAHNASGNVATADQVVQSNFAGTSWIPTYLREPTAGRYTIDASGAITTTYYPDLSDPEHCAP